MQVVLIGFGNMGRALASGWLSSLADATIHAVDPHAQPMDGIHLHKDLSGLPSSLTPDAVILAVKPQQMTHVLPLLAEQPWMKASLLLSIAAGTRITTFQHALGESQPVIRAMPNTPALIGQGMTGLVANRTATAAQRHLAETLMQSVGKTLWLEDESQMDAYTALAGSGPAYLFYFIECLTEAGVAQGLSSEVARVAAIQTMLGASMLAAASTDDVATLRARVTSPGGTTAAALEVFMAPSGMKPLVKQGILQATQRGKELGK
ncbi:pyrroline-5-carboxylate reductase [bacterium]|nr:pyrroline-5-carboxylate reductase [bacterium]